MATHYHRGREAAVRLFGEARPVELCFAWEAASLPERVRLADVAEARTFLARLSMHGHAAELHRLADPPAVRPRDDGEVLDQLARWIASGRLHVRIGPPVPLGVIDVETEEEAPGPVSFAPPPPALEEPAPPPLEALPPEDVDGAQQAAALRLAAEKGIPFCEECEKKKRKKAETDAARLDQEAMARTLVRAAEEGVPVCEECERLKKEEKKPPPPPPEDDEDEDDEDEDEEEDEGGEQRDEPAEDEDEDESENAEKKS